MRDTVQTLPITLIQRLAWVYAVLFVGVVLPGYLPGLAEGYTFDTIKLHLAEDVLHLSSALWAAASAWHSTRASTFYFKAFGMIYFLDGVIGLLLGQGYGFLDGTLLTPGAPVLEWGTKLAQNLPHLFFGGAALYIGFILSRKYVDHR